MPDAHKTFLYNICAIRVQPINIHFYVPLPYNIYKDIGNYMK